MPEASLPQEEVAGEESELEQQAMLQPGGRHAHLGDPGMRRGTWRDRRWIGIGLGAAMWVAPVLSHPSDVDRSQLELTIETPQDGAAIGGPAGMAFIAGHALAHSGDFDTFDVVFAIDQSRSTAVASGGDVNGDGRIAVDCADVFEPFRWLGSKAGICGNSLDSIFAAEVASVRTLLGQLDPRTTQVGVLRFSGDGDPKTPDAQIVVPLTAEYARVERALDDLESVQPEDRTNIREAIQLATRELEGLDGGGGEARRTARKVILLLTDGVPTLPADELDRRGGQHAAAWSVNRRVTIEAARDAAARGIRIDAYGVGVTSLAHPQVLAEVARITQGIFTPVPRPQDLQSVFERVRFSQIEELRIVNRSNEREADHIVQGADGSFGALLEMVEGINEIEVKARSSDGEERSERRIVRFVGDGGGPTLSVRLREQRNRLLETRLDELRRRNLAVQMERDEVLQRELSLHIEEERRKLRERARELRIDAGLSDSQKDSKRR